MANRFNIFQNKTTFTANLATLLFLVIATIQSCIACGLVPISIIWGGSQTDLTKKLRLASIVAAVILVSMAWVIRTRAGLITSFSLRSSSKSIRISSWIVTFYMALNTVGNFLSTNVFERYGFGCMTAILFICCWVVSSSSPSPLENENGYETFA
uniref:Uncharacterized protein n=1 Tax=Helicotheca tamesis TaxID=374047 RepID=A0A7S2N4U4_9STRA